MKSRRFGAPIQRIHSHRAKPSGISVLIKYTPRPEEPVSNQLRAFELMRHDHAAAQSLRKKRAAVQRRSAR